MYPAFLIVNSVVKSVIFPIRSMLEPFLLHCSGPGASSQIGIWESATDQVIRVIESVTEGCACVSVCVNKRQIRMGSLITDC